MLKDFPIKQKTRKNLALSPGRKLSLQHFKGSLAEGHHDSIHKLTLARLNMEDAAFVVQNKPKRNRMANETYNIEGRIRGVSVQPMRQFFSRTKFDRPVISGECSVRLPSASIS